MARVLGPASRHPGHAFTADRRHLDHLAILKDRQHRKEATAAGEVDVLQGFAGFVNDASELWRDGFERWSETVVVFKGKGREQPILRGLRRWPIARRRGRAGR